jgi:hypothetical protein
MSGDEPTNRKEDRRYADPPKNVQPFWNASVHDHCSTICYRNEAGLPANINEADHHLQFRRQIYRVASRVNLTKLANLEVLK